VIKAAQFPAVTDFYDTVQQIVKISNKFLQVLRSNGNLQVK
jgi:hypothetical protein